MNIIAGKWRGKRLAPPPDKHTRPTSARVREAIFNLLPHTLNGETVLDLYCGTGALGIEALSRGAAYADFVDVDTSLVASNLLKFSDINAKYHQLGALKFSSKKQYSLVFLDPPYNKRLVDQTIQHILRKQLLLEEAIIVAEHEVAAMATLESTVFTGLELWKQRKYGDTAVTLWRRTG